MFKYFGSKYRLVGNYPAPRYSTIVEPMAGSAAYSVRHRSVERVVLVERDGRVVELWRRLLSMSVDELLSTPNPLAGERSTDLLVAFAAGRTTRDTPAEFVVSPRMAQRYRPMVERMALVIDECRHFEIIHDDYKASADLLNESATWFVDPPYQYQGGRWDRTRGGRYRHSNQDIDYRSLGLWCDDLAADRNQVIVCEMSGADWREWNGTVEARAGTHATYREVWWDSDRDEERYGE